MAQITHLRAWIILLLFYCGQGLCQGPLPVQQPQATPSKPSAATPPIGPPAVNKSDVMSSGSRIVPLPENQPFHAAQTYVYSVEWRLFSAGTATIKLDPAGNEQRIVGTADGAGAVALLYHVKDQLETFFDSHSFCSLSMTKHTEEGLRRKETKIRFDYARKKVVLDEVNMKNNERKHTESDIPGCVTDVLSSLFYAGSLPLRVGESYTFPVNDGGKTTDVTIRVEAKEEIKVPAGTFKTVRLQPESAAGVLKNKGQLWLWYSDDGNHMPVQMRAKMFWGTLTFSLQHFERR